MKNNYRIFLSISVILAFIFTPWIEMVQPVSAQALNSSNIFTVRRDGNIYYAESQLTSSSYSGSLKSAVESAVNELNSSGGGTIAFQAGDFDLGAEWFEFYDLYNITFEGQGIDVTILRNNSSAATDTEPIDCSNCDGLTIHDLTVSAGGPLRSTSDALDFDAGDNNVLERIKVTNSRARGIVFDGKDVAGGQPRTAEGNIVRDCIITGIPTDGIELLASSSNRIENCQIFDVGGHGIQINKSSTSAGQPNKKSNDNIISGNHIENAGNDGINLVSGDRNLLTNNTILNSSDDVSNQDGIQITTGDSIACNDNIVEFNAATDNQAVKTQRYGLSISSSLCNRNIVVANNFSGNRVGDIQDYGTGTIYTSPDNDPPTAPTGLTAINVTHNQIDLTWNASTDNFGVTGYAIYRDGVLLETVNGTTTIFQDSTVHPDTTYSYAVEAFDVAGNHSGQSALLQITTPLVPPDNEPPSSPIGLIAIAVGATQINLNWIASTDNVGVTGYTIYRNGSEIATIPGGYLVYSDVSVLAATAYSYSVHAFDQAGNHSVQSNIVSITTPGIPASITFTPEADTYVNAGSPTSNYGSMTTLRADASPDVRSYLRFNIQGLGGQLISEARLLIFAITASSQGISGNVVADNNWGELTTNYNNAPAVGNILDSSGPIPAGSWVTLDVTSYLTGEGSYNFGVTTPGTTAISLASRESGLNSPQLIIDLQTGTSDTEPPSTPNGLTATAISDSQVNVNWSAATDNVGVAGYDIYRDNVLLSSLGAVTNYNDTTTAPLTTYQYTVVARDLAGNISVASDPASVTTPSDTTPPSVTLTAPLNGTTRGGALTLTAAATDNTAIEYVDFMVNGNTVGTVNTLPYSIIWNSSEIPDGTAIIAARAVDSANNLANSAGITVTIDNTPPDTTITAGPSGTVSSTSASFSFTSTESATFACSLDGATFSACTSSKTYAGLENGPHTFQVISVDAIGNTDATPASLTWIVDIIAPDTTITAGPVGLVNSPAASFSFTATEANSTFACSLDGAAFNTCTSPITYTGLTNRSHIFQVRATDALGNLDTTPASQAWTVDTVIPNTTITAGPSGSVGSPAASFSFTSTETGATFICSLDGSVFSVCISPNTYTNLTNGSHTFQVKATDAAGNTDTTPASRTWTVDTIAPTGVAITAPTNGATMTGKVALKASASDNVGIVSVSYYVDGQLLATDKSAPFSVTWNTTTVSKTTHTLYVVAVDAAGNITQSFTVTVTVR
jgi:parallel beta-helix repeat protein